MNIDAIFFIGPQGSGKGTQAKILAQKLNFFYWEMGGMLRAMRNEESALAKKVVGLIDQGVLLSDELLLEVVKSKLKQIPEGQGVIFDGIPRRLGQAEFLLGALKEQGRIHYVTLFIDLPKEESLNRLLLRAKTENRPDDTKEKIEFRLQQYYQDTLPVIDYLKQHSKFFAIDGQPPIEDVSKEIENKLELSNS